MKNLNMVFWKRLGLAAVILAAGFCYSCTRPGESVSLMEDGGGVLTQTAAVEADDSTAEVPDVLGAAVTAPETDAEIPAAAAPLSVCYVHVCGEVNIPGVYELEKGQRVCDAIERAGGFTEAAAPDYLNLAEPVQDGMKLTVPKQSDIPKPEWGPERVGYESAGAVSASRLINLNTATKEELMTLPGIGEARAGDIIRYREEHGGFEKIEDVMKISGIKKAAFQKIKEDITVSPNIS